MTDIVERLRSIGGYFDVQAADEIESLRQRVKELEGYEQECSNLEAELIDYQNCLAEIAELRKAQGEPVGVATFMPGTSGFTMAAFKSTDVPSGTPLYTSAPSKCVVSTTVPEGWQLVPIMPTKKMIENAHLAEHCGNTDWHFVRAYSAMLAAAPKYGE